MASSVLSLKSFARVSRLSSLAPPPPRVSRLSSLALPLPPPRVSRLSSLALPPPLVSRLSSLVLLSFALLGCNSYRIVQSNQFMDDDGARIQVDYGRAEKDHVNTFRSPANGQEMEFKSKLVVDVELPDGESFTAWQAMNMTGAGTLYRSDDDEWMILATGFTCRVAQRDETSPVGYREIFRGALCNTPIEKPKKDPRWRKVQQQSVRSK